MDCKILVVMLVLTILVASCSSSVKTVDTNEKQPVVNEGVPPSEPLKIDDKVTSPTLPVVIKETGSDPLKSIFDKMGSIQYMVKYTITASALDVAKGTQTIYMKNKNMRQDFNMGGQASSMYFLDGKLYSCTNTPTLSCMELPSSSKTSPIDEEKTLKDNFASVKLMPDRIISGTACKCFETSINEGTAQYCYSSEGIPLYTKMQYSGGYSEMTALEYSTTVSDADMKLPIEPQTMPKIPGYN